MGGQELPQNAEIVFHPDAACRSLGTDRYGYVFLTKEEAQDLERELVELSSRYLMHWPADVSVRREHLFLYAFAPAPGGEP